MKLANFVVSATTKLDIYPQILRKMLNKNMYLYVIYFLIAYNTEKWQNIAHE